MKTVITGMLVTALSGCAITEHRVNHAGLGLTAVALACDGGQTLNASLARSSTTADIEQGFPAALIGRRPPPSIVAAYFVTSSMILLGVAQIVPERYRPLVYASVISAEVYTVYDNTARTGIPVCGI